jgi:putative ABC transport system ATP-binding protein
MDNVRLPFHLTQRDGDSTEIAYDLLRQFQIEKLAGSLPKSLSGGELKRMAIARAMINKPAFLLADEPTGDIDAETTRMVLEIFRKAADNGMGVLMITHDPETVHFEDKSFVMNDGVLCRT